MTTYAVATIENEVGTPAFTMVADTIDTVTFDLDISTVEIISDGAAAVWFTVDGSTPAVDGAKSFYMPAAPTSARCDPGSDTATTIKLISTGTPKVRVQVA